MQLKAALHYGAVRSVPVCVATAWLECFRSDDPAGAVPVQFVNGIWGIVAVGLFASGDPDTVAFSASLARRLFLMKLTLAQLISLCYPGPQL